MESLPYELNWTLDPSRWSKPPLSSTTDSSLRYGESTDLGYHSLNCGLTRNRPHKSTKDEQGRPPDKLSSSAADQVEMQLKVDFFRKLGYTSEEIQAVLHNLGVEADTNSVLGELVKHGTNLDRETIFEEPTENILVPRGILVNRPIQGVASNEDSDENNLRPVVIDGSNVAMSHGNKEVFSCRGILLAVNFFLERGHTDITVFVPSWRKEQPRPDMPITDQHILCELEKRKILVFTPSRRVGGKRLVCYDDRFIVKLAIQCDGIIVSNDTYRDLQSERIEWKKFIEERLLMFSFVNDIFMPPDDPLGRHGPNLEDFLRKIALGAENKKIQCPYGKKCTYGIKCKFYHPERINQPQRSVADELRENARLSPTKGAIYLQGDERKTRKHSVADLPPVDSETPPLTKLPLERTSSLQKGRVVEKMTAKQFYSNGMSTSSKDSLDSGIELWTSMTNSYCDPSTEPTGYSSFGKCSQHRNDLDSNGCQPYNNSAHYFPYSPSSQWPSQNRSHPIYRREVSNTGGHHSLPNDFNPPATHSLEYWSEPNPVLPSSRHQNNYQVYPQISPSTNDLQWSSHEQYSAERLSMRTRLCAIFQPALVDAVMSRFPQILDPQSLAAEIMKSRNKI
ncbi:hypothetical protein GDO86_003642 [Hymenochirus boettgeri]|uniref:NEDD4-binding protein 1 n=1 Tax=Hymenochirus boettgeri TaxID=247094 RepID=A0A8T2K815_9PIPI|nr:hypothetical protein GDO86_003642 [Hymenochirus boettgeri]